MSPIDTNDPIPARLFFVTVPKSARPPNIPR
jgi:hypothetical protein